MAVLDHVPEGWKVVGGCTNAPLGYRFINNNKSLYMLSEYQEDTDIKTLKEYMDNMEVQYSTYSHS